MTIVGPGTAFTTRTEAEARHEDREGLRKRRHGRRSSCAACGALNSRKKRTKAERSPGLRRVVCTENLIRIDLRDRIA